MRLRDLLTGGPKPVWIRYLLLIGFFTLLTRLILDSRFATTAMLYVLVPYLVSIAIYIYVPRDISRSRLKRFINHMVLAITVMFATSAILQEGFLCVLMFLPIYLFFAAIGYALSPKLEDDRDSISNVFKVSFVPLIIICLSLEGVSQTLSFERDETITRSKTVNSDIESLKANMAMPIHMKEGRSRFLSIFPLPYEVQAGTLNQGDIHIAKFAYKRWLVTNIQSGETHLRIAEVSPNRVRTEVIKDTSYFSHYMRIKGTQIDFTPLADGQTDIELTINYTRKLDPAWYFGPLQRRAIQESAVYLIDNVIDRKDATAKD